VEAVREEDSGSITLRGRANREQALV
jgi:hypothetical protein